VNLFQLCATASSITVQLQSNTPCLSTAADYMKERISGSNDTPSHGPKPTSLLAEFQRFTFFFSISRACRHFTILHLTLIIDTVSFPIPPGSILCDDSNWCSAVTHLNRIFLNAPESFYNFSIFLHRHTFIPPSSALTPPRLPCLLHDAFVLP
jgi:hypothetical protein